MFKPLNFLFVVLLACLTLITAQYSADSPACAKLCSDKLPVADSKCDAADTACRCSDSDVMKKVVGCFLSECSDAERTKVNTDFVSYCLSITNPPIPSSVSQLALSTATTSAPKAAGADPIQTYTSLQNQANPGETSSANAANAAKGMVMSPSNVDISRTAVMATVALAALVMSVGLMGSCM